ncbi:MAG: flagellar biosynthetic protein FliO [Candidatus Kapaibacterium sp.]
MDSYIINAFGTLSIVVIALAGLLFLLKKTAGSKFAKNQIADMKVLSKLSLNPKNHLFIVQAEGKKLLLGVSESGIRTLSELGNGIEEKKYNKDTESEQEYSHDKIKSVENLSFSSFIKSTFSNSGTN